MRAAAAIARRLIQRMNMKPAPARLQAPVASLTFDDFPKSAWTVAGPRLKARGLRATYYVAGSLAGRTIEGVRYFDPEDVAAVAAAGHELGCHGFSHQGAPRLPGPELEDDFERNASFLKSLRPGLEVSSFAFPYGEASRAAKRLASRRFGSARGITRGINRGLMDLSQLKAVGLERSRYRPRRIEALLDECVRNPGWIIFFTHDVSDDCSPYGATPSMLETLLEGLSARGIAVLPVNEALKRAVTE